jgi:hypothetical protein
VTIDAGMKAPNPPKIAKLPHISPSIYAAARLCRARAAWTGLKTRPRLPQHPSGILGLCFHAVVEKAATGELAAASDGALNAARDWFDGKCRELYESAHPLLRLKFRTPDRLPGYYLFRERAAVAALNAFTSPRARNAVQHPPSGTDSHNSIVERRFESSDGKLVGRPDVINALKGEVTDYKTGLCAGDDLISDAELRQLRLYVNLASENGISVNVGVIARANGRRLSVCITPLEASGEAKEAKDSLDELNEAIGAGADFRQLAEPSASGCRLCPCVPFCEKFWETAESGWLDDCGAQLEGSIAAIARSTLQGLHLVSLMVDVRRGTIPTGLYAVEQVPSDWLLVGESKLPEVGETIRILDARRLSADPTTLRVDRTATTLWSTAGTPPAGGSVG